MKNLEATREHLYMQAGLNQTAHDALMTFEALVIRIAELEAAALNILKHTPCSDPDCCSTARAEFAARERLRETLNFK